MMPSSFAKTGIIPFLAGLLTIGYPAGAQQCPTLGQNATLSSPDCIGGTTPCDVCPGDQITLTPSGTNLPPGACVNWYFGPSNNFNPYGGGGTLMGCSEIQTTPPNSCAPCPLTLGLFVDACGTEQNNEFIALYSGGGFFVDLVSVDYDSNNDNGNGNEDIGGGCTWQTPSAFAINSIQADCGGVTVLGAGPGQSVPPGVPVIVFTSSDLDQDYNFSALCAVAPLVYVMQSSCARSQGAFANNGANGLRTTIVSLSCGCSQATTYNTGSLVGGNGAFVTDAGFPPFYGNAGCGYPAFPPGPGGAPPPITVASETFTITNAMCNMGPFWAVGIVEPLAPGCPQTFTNYIPFNVPCPTPVLGTDDICADGGLYDLDQIADPAVPDGAWSGPGVSGGNFNPSGLSGPVSLTFTPAAACGNAVTTTVQVLSAPTAAFAAVPAVCAGEAAQLTVTFTGQGPWTFDLLTNGGPAGSFSTSDNPFTVDITVNGPTTVSLVNLVDGSSCVGANTSVNVPVLPSPTATLSGGSTSVCPGETIDLEINFTGTGPYTFVYAVNGINQPAQTTPSNPFTLQIVPNLGNNIYTLISVSAGGCNGPVSGSYSAEVALPPTGQLSGDATVCAGDTAQLSVAFTGAGPYTFTYTANGSAQPPLTTGQNPFMLPAAPVVSTVYGLTAVSGACAGTGSGQAQVTVLPVPEAALSGGGQICQGGAGTDLSVTFQGPGPYTFVYSIGNVAQPPITTSDNPYVIHVNPNVGTTYSLLSVSNPSCAGTASGAALVFVFTPPTALMTGSQTFCDSALTEVMVDFTGTGPFTIIYSQDGVAMPTVQTFDDPYLIPVATTATTMFSLLTVESPGCVGDPVGQATITVNHTPTVTGLQQSCDPASGSYVVTFDVLNAALPLTLTAGSGSFSGATFSSDPLPQSQAYSFSFHDAVNCGEVSVGGMVTCNCVTDAGSMAAQPDTACVTDMVSGQHNGDAVLDGGDVLRFVLQTGPGQPLGQVLAWNTVPVFGFLPGMQPGVTYYISAVSGDPDGSGNVSLTDPCLTVSPGQPVLFQPLPGAVLEPLDTNLCAGQPLDLTVNFTGTAPFSFVPVYGGMAQPALSNLPGPFFTWTFTPQADLQVTLMAVGDRFCSGGTVSGTATVGLNAPPEIQALQVTCDNATATYALTFSAQNGLAPYTVSGLAGAFTGALFMADPVPFGTPYAFQLSDAFGCGVANASGTASCGCMTVAGVMDPAPVTGCLADTLSVPAAAGTVLEPGDVLLYILHTAPGQPVGTVLAWSSTPDFGFQPGMQPGLPYFISPIAGNPSGGLIDLNDPCLSVGTGTPVTWFAPPTATLAGNFDICTGTAQPLTVMLTGTAPYSLSYTHNGQPTTTTALQNTFVINATLLQTSTFQLTAVQDAHCPGQASGQAVVTVHLPPEITGLAVTCSPDNQTFTVEFDVLNAGTMAGALGLGGFPGGSFDPATGHFTGDPVPIQDPAYAITVTDLLWGCGADSVSGSVVCNCITGAGTMDPAPLLLCYGQDAVAMPVAGAVLEPGDTLLYLLVDSPSADPASWTVLSVGATPSFAFPAGQVEPGTTYYIVAAAGDPAGGGLDWNDPCLALAPGPAVSWRAPVAATISGNLSVCSGSSATLEIPLSGSGPFTLIYAANGIPDTVLAAASPYLLTLTPTVDTDLDLIGVSGAGNCPGTVGGSAGVTITPAPSAMLSGDTSVCAGGSAQLEIAFSGLPPFIFTYSRNGVALPPQNALLNTFIVQATNVQQEQTFELLSVQNGQCPGTAEGTATIEVLPTPAAALSAPAAICAGDSAALVLTLTGADSFQLTILGGLAPVFLTQAANGTSVVVSPPATTTYQLSGVVASGNLCPVLLGPAVEVAVSSVTLGSVLSDYNGFNLSCPNSSDGSITLTASSPAPPFNVLWDNGSGGLYLDLLSAGLYQVTVTDGAGCSAAASFTLMQPPELQVAWQAAQPRCHGQSDGSIAVQSIQGGSGPFQLMLDGVPVMLADTFPSLVPGLAAGDYLLEVEDANGCVSDTTLHLEDAAELWVDLGADTTLAFGDSLVMEALVSDPSFDTLIWSPAADINAPGSLIQTVTPLRSVLYEVVVRNDSGCIARDERRVMVEKQRRVFLPTAIRPGADLDANAVFTVYAGPEVRRVPVLRVYDRWGECVFEKTDLIPNDPAQGWRGRWREQEVPPGVYVYVVELEFLDGSTDILSGDVTVLR